MSEADYIANEPVTDNELEYYFGVACERCGLDGFHWGYDNYHQSRLFTKHGNLHICSQPKSSIPKGGYTCKRCGETGLQWNQTESGLWRLHYKNGTIHEC